MKTHTKKKVYRAWLKAMAKEGYMNNAAGYMVKRAGCPDNAMKRDYNAGRS